MIRKNVRHGIALVGRFQPGGVAVPAIGMLLQSNVASKADESNRTNGQLGRIEHRSRLPAPDACAVDCTGTARPRPSKARSLKLINTLSHDNFSVSRRLRGQMSLPHRVRYCNDSRALMRASGETLSLQRQRFALRMWRLAVHTAFGPTWH